MRDHDTSTRPPTQAALRQRAYEAGDQTISGRSSANLVQYYRFLVRTSGSRKWDLAEYAELAEEFGVSIRTVQRWDRSLEDWNLIRRDKVGHNYRRTVTAMCIFEMPPDLDDEEAIANLEPVDGPANGPADDASNATLMALSAELFGTDEHDTTVVLHTIKMSCSSINNNHSGSQGGGSPPPGPPSGGGGGNRNQKKLIEFSGRTIPDTPTARKLIDLGVISWRKIEEFSHRTIEEVEQAIAYAESRGSGIGDKSGYVLGLLSGPPNGPWRKQQQPKETEYALPEADDTGRTLCPLANAYGDNHSWEQCHGLHGPYGWPYVDCSEEPSA